MPDDILVVDNPTSDPRFKNNPLVLNDPKIKFYAGAPLKSKNGNVLGTLCVIDNKPNKITDSQKAALRLLAKKAMDYLESKKELWNYSLKYSSSSKRLVKLADLAPGAVFELELKIDGAMCFTFLSQGMKDLHPDLDLELLKKDARLAVAAIHQEDQAWLRQSLTDSAKNLSIWNVEYRVSERDGQQWHWANARPEKMDDGRTVWYGTFQDITTKKDYIALLEQNLFDISHVMRRPVTTLMSLSAALLDESIDANTRRTLCAGVKTIAEEMDMYSKKLNNSYLEMKSKFSADVKPTNQDQFTFHGK